jgi:hypothetical protein
MNFRGSTFASGGTYEKVSMIARESAESSPDVKLVKNE